MPLLQQVRRIFSAQSLNGALYDYSNISSLNQLSTGTTPVAVVTDPVGFSADSRFGMALGPELVTNGDFSNGTTGYILVGGAPLGSIAVVAGELEVTGIGGASPAARQSITTVIGQTYTAAVRARKGTGTNASLTLGINTAATTSTSLVYIRVYFVATATTTNMQLGVTGTGTAYFDNISVKLLDGNHALQATAAARPTWTNWVNLLTYSEDFSNAAWVKSATASVTGTNTLNFPAVADSVAQTIAAYSPTGKPFYPNITLSGSGTITVQVSNGVDFAVNSIVTLTGTPTEYTFAVAMNATAAASTIFNIFRNTGNTATSVTATKAHLSLGTTATRYQRVTTATDFDTVGFPYYLSFLGTDDSLTSATGGGGSAGFFWCGVVQPTGGAGTIRTLFADNGTNTGNKIQLDTSNKLSYSAGNNTAFTTKASTATVDVGTKYLLTVRDNGTNLSVQINSAAAETVARPVVVAGSAGFTIGKDNGAASNFAIANIYSQVYFKDTGLTDAQVAAVQSWVRSKAGL